MDLHNSLVYLRLREAAPIHYEACILFYVLHDIISSLILE
jgi:hypothetical protein